MSSLSVSGPRALLPSAEQTSPVVFVVDDDISVREGLESLIAHEGFQVVGFACARSFLEHPYTLRPSCLLLDISMPGLTGLELQQSLAVDRPAMPIVFITGHQDALTVVQAMKGGALEYLTKPLDVGKVLEAVKSAIAHSEILLGKEIRKNTLQARYAELTRREREVFALVVEGLLNREIGDTLCISEITVKAHRGQVMRKMEAATLAELFRMAGDIQA